MKNDTNLAFCESDCTHSEAVKKIKSEMPDEGEFIESSEFFKAFSDTTRLRILKLLVLSEMCVCDIVHILDMTQPAISHHLKLLKSMRLVKYRKAGKYVYYSLSDDHIHQIITAGFDHIKRRNCTI